MIHLSVPASLLSLSIIQGKNLEDMLTFPSPLPHASNLSTNPVKSALQAQLRFYPKSPLQWL